MPKAFLELLCCFAVISFGGAFLMNQDTSGFGNAPFVYENYNQVDYGPLKIRIVLGKIHDEQGTVITNAQLGMFTEENHRLVATATTEQDGAFRFDKISPGRYRLVAKFDGFCPANVPLLIVSSGHSNRIIDVHMRLRGIDTCSFGELVKSSRPRSDSN